MYLNITETQFQKKCMTLNYRCDRGIDRIKAVQSSHLNKYSSPRLPNKSLVVHLELSNLIDGHSFLKRKYFTLEGRRKGTGKVEHTRSRPTQSKQLSIETKQSRT